MKSEGAEASSSDPSISRKQILSIARKHFGFEELRPGQEEAIEAVTGGQDTLVVAPTGSGKSAIYQIAGLLLEGTVIVVSPLIALQKDQVEVLNSIASGAPAVVINSTKKVSEVKEDFEKLERGEVKFVFLAPEQLAKEETLESLSRAPVSLFVVDEAHCVSEWGHDFRPDYIGLGHVIERLNHPVVLAMTATASAKVRDEIVLRLKMKDPAVLVGGFDRPNIHLRVDRYKDAEKKLEGLVHRVRWSDKPGIIYVGTRKEAESIMRGLSDEGMDALFYHGGLKAADRDSIQDRFMSGEAEVIVATNAFGMGIDKSDIRFVYHFDSPDSLDAYYQEIGRAGRNGEPAEAILFFREEDIGAQSFHTASAKIDPELLERIAELLGESPKGLTKEEIAERTGLSARRLAGVLHQMEDSGAIRHMKSGAFRLTKDADLAETVQEASEQKEQWKERNKERLEQMREYADASACRRAVLLRYFGEDAPDQCGNCDNCEAKAPEAALESSGGTRVEVV